MTGTVRLMGVAGAPGIAVGPIWRFGATEPVLPATSRQGPGSASGGRDPGGRCRDGAPARRACRPHPRPGA